MVYVAGGYPAAGALAGTGGEALLSKALQPFDSVPHLLHDCQEHPVCLFVFSQRL